MRIENIHPFTKIFIFGFIAVLSITHHTDILLSLLTISGIFAFISGGSRTAIRTLVLISPFIILTSALSILLHFKPPGGITGFVIRISTLVFITAFISSSLTITEIVFLGIKFKIPEMVLLSVISAFRFAPAIMRDLKLLLNSSKMEDMGKFRTFLTLPTVLFSTALDRAEVLAMSMRVRDMDVGRLSYRPEKGLTDVILLAFTIFPVVIVSII